MPLGSDTLAAVLRSFLWPVDGSVVVHSAYLFSFCQRNVKAKTKFYDDAVWNWYGGIMHSTSVHFCIHIFQFWEEINFFLFDISDF